MSRPLHLVLVGPPGAGKSTIAEQIEASYPLTIIATGQQLRAEMAAGTELGRRITPYMESGNLVPDGLMDRLLRSRLEQLPADKGFLLDGYPRTLNQGLGLVGMLADAERPLHGVIALELDDQEVLQRLSNRRICEGAGDPFPVNMSDTAQVEDCLRSGGRLVQRDDDTPALIRIRLQVYYEQTAPLLDFYRREGLLLPIDAHGTPQQVGARVSAALAQLA